MHRSQLLLNHTWRAGNPVAGLEDGILTAFEISLMNLERTELAVLSACETGLGDIYNSEGVFGLQRAFKEAGVDQLVLSLWKVPDRETSELMQQFYKYYLEGNDASSALRKAQIEMSESHPPLSWAGFMLIE